MVDGFVQLPTATAVWHFELYAKRVGVGTEETDHVLEIFFRKPVDQNRRKNVERYNVDEIFRYEFCAMKN